jgi:hypothetical protein
MTTRKQTQATGDSSEERWPPPTDTATVTGTTPPKASTVRTTADSGSSTDRGPRIEYIPKRDATPESEFAALANVYRFMLDRAERRKDVAADDAEKRGGHGT